MWGHTPLPTSSTWSIAGCTAAAGQARGSFSWPAGWPAHCAANPFVLDRLGELLTVQNSSAESRTPSVQSNINPLETDAVLSEAKGRAWLICTLTGIYLHMQTRRNWLCEWGASERIKGVIFYLSLPPPPPDMVLWKAEWPFCRSRSRKCSLEKSTDWCLEGNVSLHNVPQTLATENLCITSFFSWAVQATIKTPPHIWLRDSPRFSEHTMMTHIPLKQQLKQKKCPSPPSLPRSNERVKKQRYSTFPTPGEARSQMFLLPTWFPPTPSHKIGL